MARTRHTLPLAQDYLHPRYLKDDQLKHLIYRSFINSFAGNPNCLLCLGVDTQHVHLLLRTGLMPITTVMRRLLTGYDFDWLVDQVATLFGLEQDIVTRPGRYPDTVEARSVLCYWAARELGLSTLELSKRLGISQPTASQSVKRGEKIVKEMELKMME
ncbi:MAG: hypothetical protein ABIK98_14015 [Pseudomonadota bacterium]|uniref:Chromosomal replication initiator DnaA C-terminal domain-containing protein n=1 Tax=Candidatus Desulfatibia profunda TaxID=2841695 RepID=A0A8J6TMF6_9BACT|nr:hypothetical protein [Candidatus Desulfatibia profunda]MBL7180029.1 hypothetical protein [Desulfobacterales bacterium]